MRNIIAGGISIALLLAGSVQGFAQTPYYEGKVVKFVVGFSPGGGTDFFGRLLADNIGQYIDGNPTVIVENMPGAGSVIASNYYVDRAERDGTEIMVGTGQLLMRIVLGLEGSTARVADLEPLVSLPMGRITYGNSAAGIETPADLLDPKEPLILGVPGVVSTIDAVLGLKVIGADYQAIVGYEGKSEAYLAFERNEVNLDSQTTPIYLNQVATSVKEGRAVPLFAQGLLNGLGELVRDPGAPDIPTVAEVYEDLHGKPPSGPAWEAFKAAVTAIGNGGKILMIHSDAPDEAKAALNEAIGELLQDKDFLAKAAEAADGYDFVTGAELIAAVDAVANMSEGDVAWFRDFLSTDFDVQFD